MKKIAVIGENDVDSLAWHIEYTLKKMGLDAYIFEPSGGVGKRILDKNIQYYLTKFSLRYEISFYKKLIDNIIKYKPNLVIVILRNIPPFVIKKIKDHLNIKVIFWTGDAFINLERGYSLISNYDAWFVKDTYMCDFMQKKLNLNVFLLPECFNPYCHKPPKEALFGSINEITIAGTLYPYRAKILEKLTDKFDISIYGNLPKWMSRKWKKLHTNRYIRLEEKSKIFYTSKVNLNTLHYGEVNAGNCRLFEIAGSGGFQICDKKKEIKNYFVEDKEIVFFDTLEELIYKINYYLKHQDEAEAIARNAYKRAISEHTYRHRILKIFEIIGFRY